MATTNLCPSCGQPLAPNAPKGLCPACLMKAAFPTGTQGDDPAASAQFVPPKPEELAPHFPQLEILEYLGRGGMGVVYKARQKTLDRFVALKLLAPERVKDPHFAERFLREAKALARLNHPNIVTVHDFGESNGLYFLLMEYMDGLNLRELLRARKIAPAEALGIVPRICEALQYAHDQGIVHRDIKPENILLDKQGRVKIADFGIAKLLGQEHPTAFTQEEQVIGTPHYMAPEQTEKPQQVDHRADIYSVGVVFYEMLTGELPLGKFSPPSQKVLIDVRLDEVVLRALEKEPEHRFQTARVLKTQVETIAATPSDPLPANLYAPETAPQKKINWIPALVFYVFADLVWLGATLVQTASPGIGFGVFFIGLPFWGCSTALWAMLHYSCWQALPPKFRETTPIRAIGLMFVPFFNWYWAFVSYPQLAEGYNALRAERSALPLKDVKGLGIASGVIFVLAWTVVWFVPYIPIAVAIGDLLVFTLFYHATVANANLVIESARTGKVQASTGWPASAIGALLMIIASVPLGIGAFVALIGILADGSWHPAASELAFVISLFGAAILAAAGCVSFGVITSRQIKNITTTPGAHFAARTAVWLWPGMLVLALIGFLGFGRFTSTQRVQAEAQRRAAVEQELKALAALPGGGKGVPVGAIVERVVNEIESEKGHEALSLNTAQRFSFGDSDLTTPGALADWCRTNQVDLLVALNKKRWSLISPANDGLVLSDFPNDHWGATNATEVTAALSRETSYPRTEQLGLRYFTLSKNSDWPVTFAFRTASGREGILQVTGATAEPSALKLRYKFLR